MEILWSPPPGRTEAEHLIADVVLAPRKTCKLLLVLPVERCRLFVVEGKGILANVHTAEAHSIPAPCRLGPYGWLLASAGHLLPVCLGKQRRSAEVLGATLEIAPQPEPHVDGQQALDRLGTLPVGRVRELDTRRRSERPVHSLCRLAVTAGKREDSEPQSVEQDPEGPKVHRAPVRHSTQQLGRYVLWRAAHCVRAGGAGRQHLGQAKVGEADVPSGIQQHVLKLEVAVEHPAVVKVPQS
mmetsp:Transcript_12057/g.31064  ORF Transcript_12057/g.31064 Transcript_12057/m.31064 type:complete len:241 (+) Transcript_12057:199-921(+)